MKVLSNQNDMDELASSAYPDGLCAVSYERGIDNYALAGNRKALDVVTTIGRRLAHI